MKTKKEFYDLNYVFNKNIIYRDTGNLLMAYNQENSDMYEFNEIGGEIFKLLQKEKSIAEIFDILSKEYSVLPDEIYEDVYDIVKRMIDLNIVKLI